jgi:hypothetical protein
MVRLTIDVVNPKEEALFLAILETFKNQKVIRLRKKEIIDVEKENFALPGRAMTQDELDNEIEIAEQGKDVSYEEMRKYFDS